LALLVTGALLAGSVRQALKSAESELKHGRLQDAAWGGSDRLVTRLWADAAMRVAALRSADGTLCFLVNVGQGNIELGAAAGASVRVLVVLGAGLGRRSGGRRRVGSRGVRHATSGRVRSVHQDSADALRGGVGLARDVDVPLNSPGTTPRVFDDPGVGIRSVISRGVTDDQDSVVQISSAAS